MSELAGRGAACWVTAGTLSGNTPGANTEEKVWLVEFIEIPVDMAVTVMLTVAVQVKGLRAVLSVTLKLLVKLPAAL